MASGRIPKAFIDDLLVRVDLVDLIDSRLPLKKSGNNFVARCPFHNEKTPSFSVNRTRQMYHCFGCGASGNAIGFLMNYSHLNFVEAVEDLASFVGVDVPREALRAEQQAVPEVAPVAHLYDVLEDVARYYAEQLRMPDAAQAVQYLKSRGVSGEIARDFGLGYAGQHWDRLLARFDKQMLIDAGLLVVKEDGKAYDRFRGRLMFPIRDRRKRVVGFGGRVLDDSLPKYLNSPETAVFSKSKELYGLCELLAHSGKPPRILVVEGYMDVIALAQFGIRYAVAALGTATSSGQIELLFRYCSELVFCFDGDQAGRKAAWKATEAALAALRDGRQIKIMLLPQGHDPDSLVREEGVDGFLERVASAQLLSDYFFDTLSADLVLDSVEGRARLAAQARPQLQKLPEGFFRDMMLQRLDRLTGARASSARKNNMPRADARKQASVKRLSLPRKVLALLLQNPFLAQYLHGRLQAMQGMDFPGRSLLELVLHTIERVKPENAAILLEEFRDTAHEQTVAALIAMALDVPEGDERIEFEGALTQLEKQAKQRYLESLLSKAQQQGLSSDEKHVLRRLLGELS
jgi:DNA primase